MYDTLTPIAPKSNTCGGAALRPRNVGIVISKEAARLAEKRALSRRDWRTTNGIN